MRAPVEIDAEPGAVCLRVSGTLDAELSAELHARLREAPARGEDGGAIGLIIDLRKLRSFDDAGYKRLVTAQRELAAAERRSAYIISRPRIRAMIFKVIHITEDERARPVVSVDSARAWLAERGSVSYAAESLMRAKELLERLRKRPINDADPRGRTA